MDWLDNTCQNRKLLSMSAINKLQSIQRKLTWDQGKNWILKHHTSAFTNRLSKFALACWIHNPFVKTYLHLSTTCYVAPIPMSHSAAQTDVPTSLRIGMAHRRSAWKHQPRERCKSVDRTHNVCHTKAQFQQVHFWVTPHQFLPIPQLTIRFFKIYSLFWLKTPIFALGLSCLNWISAQDEFL